MKVVFDENMPAAMLRVFRLFHKERSLKHIVQGVDLESAKDYTPNPSDADHSPKNDAPWIRRYASAGGKIIISGDTKMTLVPHERLALIQEGMVVVLFAPKWANWSFTRKAALLLHWWPTILRHVKKAKPGFYAVPCTWPEEKAKLRAMPMEDKKLVKIQKQITETAVKREARRLKRQAPATAQKGLFKDDKEPVE